MSGISLYEPVGRGPENTQPNLPEEQIMLATTSASIALTEQQEMSPIEIPAPQINRRHQTLTSHETTGIRLNRHTPP